jgi:organic hydroperoxide reductase OsmC/OhrA
MTRQLKTYRFPVEIRWLGGRITCASAAGKPELKVATPPEFRGGVDGVWSPEDLLVASAAACFAVTLVGIAERRGLPLRALGVQGTGSVRRSGLTDASASPRSS